MPVISSRVGGIAEVIDNENGILVESENTKQLADAMQQLMDNYAVYDKGKIAAAATEKFNYNNIGRQITDFYK